MNYINNKINHYSSYFHGFQDLFEQKSAKKCLIGAVKIISYVSVILPVIFAIAYLSKTIEKNNLVKLRNRVTKSLDHNFKGKIPTQNEYIKFLTSKVRDKENDVFGPIFEKLTPASQGRFFADTSKTGDLTQAMKYVPKGVTQLECNLGRFENPSKFEEARVLISEFNNELSQFHHLNQMVLDLSGIVSYSKRVEGALESRLKLSESFKHINASCVGQYDMINDGYGSCFLNNYSAASEAINGLINHFKAEKSLKKVDIRFKDSTVTVERVRSKLVVTKILGKNRQEIRQFQ